MEILEKVVTNTFANEILMRHNAGPKGKFLMHKNTKQLDEFGYLRHLMINHMEKPVASANEGYEVWPMEMKNQAAEQVLRFLKKNYMLIELSE